MHFHSYHMLTSHKEVQIYVHRNDKKVKFCHYQRPTNRMSNHVFVIKRYMDFWLYIISVYILRSSSKFVLWIIPLCDLCGLPMRNVCLLMEAPRYIHLKFWTLDKKRYELNFGIGRMNPTIWICHELSNHVL